jgi:hypothetical protein
MAHSNPLEGMKMTTRKFDYIKVIQGNYGQGWEDVSEYGPVDSGYSPLSQVKSDWKEYLISRTGSYRLISRRVLRA